MFPKPDVQVEDDTTDFSVTTTRPTATQYSEGRKRYTVDELKRTMLHPSPFLYRATAISIILPLCHAGGPGLSGLTGSGRLAGHQCPGQIPNNPNYTTEEILVYSPFKPYWQFDVPNRTDANTCWVVADCLFEAAGESRKQQFGATALVMGLLPGTTKDIAWPERRVVYVTQRLSLPLEVLVLALELVPQVTGKTGNTRFLNCEGTRIAQYSWSLDKIRIKILIASSTFVLLLCYACLAIMEIFSKRSALGCVVPIFIVAWHILALLPAKLHSFFMYRSERTLRKPASEVTEFHHERQEKVSPESVGPSAQSGVLQRQLQIDGNEASQNVDDRSTCTRGVQVSLAPPRAGNIASAVQGANEVWPVQMLWGVYYIAGTLFFASIMAVTVPELVLWIILAFLTTGCSKVLAFFLCLANEETGIRRLVNVQPSQTRLKLSK